MCIKKELELNTLFCNIKLIHSHNMMIMSKHTETHLFQDSLLFILNLGKR